MKGNISERGLDFSAYMAERTEHFTGREWVFQAINDWLPDPDWRPDSTGASIFLLTGQAGSGKSAVAARLAQMSDGIDTGVSFSKLTPGWLSYYHFCRDGLDSTLSPLTFVKSLSETLANRYSTFRTALERAGSQQNIFNVNVTQNVGTVAPDGQVIAVQVQIGIKGGNARTLFDLAVRGPLQNLCKQSPTERVIILLDALDEAFTFNEEDNIVQLLKLVNDFPAQVLFICTCRSRSDRVLDILGKPKKTLDLITDADANLDEVNLYAKARLQAVPEPARSDAASRIAEQSKSNFLYAYHVLNDLTDLIAQGVGIGDPDKLDLPNELEDVYRKFLKREIALNRTKWNDNYRPLLGLITVARGNGLTRDQLVGITELKEETADDVLRVCAQYLAGSGTKDSPYRIYHQSFREFLTHDKEYNIYPAERHAAIASYLQEKYKSSWNDEYALRYTPTHWAEAATMSTAERETRTKALIELTQNSKYRSSFERYIGDIPALKQHLHRAVQVAALNDRVDMLPWLIKAPLAYAAFHEKYLQAESVVQLAEEGNLDQAEARLRLFSDVEEDWQVAARLIIAWLGVERNPAAAEQLRTRVTKTGTATEPLPLLMNRVAAALGHLPIFPFEAQPAESLEVARELVKRVSGQAFDRELLLSINPSMIAVGQPGPDPEMLAQRGYAAAFDAPLLVNVAREHGGEGTTLVDTYIDAHKGYSYVEYRNRSLWFVLQAILDHHPDQVWVMERLRLVLVAALAGGGVDFREMLPITAALLREQAEKGNVRLALDNWRSQALQAADELQSQRGANDSWGSHKRRLTEFMELYHLLLGDAQEAKVLLDRIRALPDGFAGFQAPAYLRLADALRACDVQAPGLLGEIVENALQYAHHIQDYHFCARMTARCNALKRWHQVGLTGQQLADTIKRLAESPSDGEFAANHFIHEPYHYRDKPNPDLLPITNAQEAETLEQLVSVFQRPAVEFRRLNPQYGLTQPLDDRTPVRVPDPGFAPLLAVHLGARVLAENSLEEDRGPLLRALVPVAASNPTALDTVLSYLLITNQPEDAKLLEEIVGVTGPVVFADETPSPAQIGPDAATPS